ncbi:MAG TPA: TetR/AcrR family transcriptional regulator [Anaerolineae bacterium]|nr:TetR/AcrR family transcriptional regulator [Anaerolineae bacterium]
MAQQRGTDTRNRLLDVAGELFAQRGYDATSVANICERAGVTKGAFYHHFATKQQVFLDLRDRWLAPLDAQFKLTRAEGETLPQLLHRIAEMTQPIFEAVGNEQRQQIFLELLSAARHDAAILPALLTPRQKYRDLFANLIQIGVAEGTLREVDVQLAAEVVVALGFGYVMQSLLDPGGADWAQLAQQSIGLLMHGLAA